MISTKSGLPASILATDFRVLLSTSSGVTAPQTPQLRQVIGMYFSFLVVADVRILLRPKSIIKDQNR